jgi:hypothetical protein
MDTGLGSPAAPQQPRNEPAGQPGPVARQATSRAGRISSCELLDGEVAAAGQVSRRHDSGL